MKAVVAAFNQEKALVGAFSVIANLRMELFQALVPSLAVTGTFPNSMPGSNVRNAQCNVFIEFIGSNGAAEILNHRPANSPRFWVHNNIS